MVDNSTSDINDGKETYKIARSKSIVLSDGLRGVSLSDVFRKSDLEESKLLTFISEEGFITKVGLSLEAYEALKLLMTDPNAGSEGMIALEKTDTIMYWHMFDNKEDKANEIPGD